MSATHVNSVSINGSSAAAVAYSVTVPSGTGIAAGDLIVVAADGNYTGTRVSDGMKVQDSVNKTAYTTIGETEQGGSSHHWMQTFYYRTPQAIPDGSAFTFTPPAGSTANSFSVDVFRGTTGAIVQAMVGQSNTAGTSQGAPALGAAPAAGSLVLTFCGASSGTLSAGSPFTLGSANQGSGGVQSTAIGYVLSASGSSTYASTWTDSSSQTSATQTVAFGASAPATLAITTTSPLPGGQVAVPYSDTLAASGGIPPYTWSIASGSLPAGLSLASGSGGSGGSDFSYVGVNTGPQGAPTEAQFAACEPVMGPIGCYKTFYTSLPSSWSGTLMDQITQAYPGVFCYISWSTVESAAAIANFIATIPHSIPAVGFVFDSEPENSSAYSSGADFVSKYNDQAGKVHAAQVNTPVQLVMMTASYTNWYQTGGNNSYIPPASSVDVYGMDFYDRKVYWAGNDMSSTVAWKTWLGYVQNLGKPLALTEFGISGAGTDAAQNARLQADWAYLQAAFGPGGSVSGWPLYVWLYWNTGGTAYGGSNINEFLGPQTEGTWAAIAATAASQGSSGGGTGTGGVISGTPTTAGTQAPTIEVTDSSGATATAALSLTVSAAGTLAVTSTSLPGATVNAAYSTLLTASGGSGTGYTWAVTAGSLPSGMSLNAATGLISGQAGATGTSSFTVQVTDSASNTATAAVSITVSSTLTVTTTALPAGEVSQAYTTTLGAAGGTSPYTWSLVSGTLPAGLTLDPDTGIISGTPTVSGSFTLVFQVTDETLAVATSASLTLAVALSGGGLPAIGRMIFGGDVGTWGWTQGTGDAVNFTPGATWQFYDAKTGGTQYTDLQTYPGGTAISSVTLDANGYPPQFYAPAGVGYMWADANSGAGPRFLVHAVNAWDVLIAAYAALQSLVG